MNTLSPGIVVVDFRIWSSSISYLLFVLVRGLTYSSV